MYFFLIEMTNLILQSKSFKFFHPLICLRSQEQASPRLTQEAKTEHKTYIYIVGLIAWRLDSKAKREHVSMITKHIRKKTIVTS